MPLARTVGGLIRRAGNFLSGCCCKKKWLCDPTTYQCSEDFNGTYDSETECKDACKPSFACDTSTYTCFETVGGAYATLKECEDQCKEEKTYCCGTSPVGEDRDCYDTPCDLLGLAEFGVYDTPGECDDACEAPHYKCDPVTKICTEDPLGPYTDYGECERNCLPDKYDCDFTTYSCYLDPDGPYDSASACANDCKPPPDTYVCVKYGTDYNCVPYDNAIDPSLIISTHDTPDCDLQCPPDYAFYCCEDPDGVLKCYDEQCPPGYIERGGYDVQSDCENDCGNYYSCEVASDGSSSCVPDPSGPYKSLAECQCVCPQRYSCVDQPDGSRKCEPTPCGSYDTPDCDGLCSATRYGCRDNGDSTLTCVPDPAGPYTTPDCQGNCPPEIRYSCEPDGLGGRECVEKIGGTYDTPNCEGDCDPARYSCVDLFGGGRACVADPAGPYLDPNCNGDCVQQRYRCDGGWCVPDAAGPYTNPLCDGECDPNFLGRCCTEYGLPVTTKDQCQQWGGTWYFDPVVAEQACACDCNAEPYTVRNDCPGVDCTGPNSGIVFVDSPECIREQGGVAFPMATAPFANDCCNADCSPITGGDQAAFDEMVAKGARFIRWLQYAANSNFAFGSECCRGESYRYAEINKTFVYRCDLKEWKEVTNVLSCRDFTNFGDTPPGSECNGGWAAGIPLPAPDGVPLDRHPTCSTLRAPNPLP